MMARNKTETHNESHAYTEEDAPKLPSVSAAADEHSRNNLAINQQFGLEIYNKDKTVSECAFYLSHSAESMFEAGKRLIQLKENEQHGDFLSIINENFGLDIRTAQLMMQASVKYLSPELASNTKSISHLGKTKLFALMTQETEVLAEFTSGGTVAGLKLDDVERMTVRELKAALRQTRTEAAKAVEIKESIIANKDKKINELDEKLTTIQLNKQNEPKPTPVFKPVGTDELEAIQKLTLHINAAIGGDVRHAIDRFWRAFGDEMPNRAMQLGLAHCIGHIITTLNDVADEYLIQPATELDHADEDPTVAMRNDFEAWQANGGVDELTPEIEAFNQRMAAHQNNPVGEQFSDWEEQGGDATQLFDFDE
jgi:hypothetical protein